MLLPSKEKTHTIVTRNKWRTDRLAHREAAHREPRLAARVIDRFDRAWEQSFVAELCSFGYAVETYGPDKAQGRADYNRAARKLDRIFRELNVSIRVRVHEVDPERTYKDGPMWYLERI